jgi:hypothetical protein
MPVPLQAGQRSSAISDLIRFIALAAPAMATSYQLQFSEIAQSITHSNLEQLG